MSIPEAAIKVAEELIWQNSYGVDADALARKVLATAAPFIAAQAWKEGLAAGYPKPREVETAEDLDALPSGSVVRCDDTEGIGLNVAERSAEGWTYVGSSLVFTSAQLASDEVPFTVLWEPQP